MRVDEARRRHFGAFYGIDPLPADGTPRVLMLGNCQAEALRIAASSVVGGAPFASFRVPAVHELTTDDLPHLERLLPWVDVLAMQPIRADYRGLPVGTEQLRARLRPDARVVLLPTVRDPGPYPYQVLVRGAFGDPPVVPYTDLRTLASVAGLSAGPAEHEGGEAGLADAYRGIAAEGVAELRRRQEAHGSLPADDLLAATTGQSWTVNHPSNALLLALGDRLRAAVGVGGESVDPGRVLLRSVRSPLQAEVIDALGLDQSPRQEWLVAGEPLDDEVVRAAQAAWLRQHPDAVEKGLERYGERMRLLGWRW